MVSLNEQDVEFYRQQGYLLPHQQLFAPEKLAKLQAIFEEHLALKGSRLSDELDTPHFWDERLFEFLLSREALDCVEPLIGPNIGLWSSHFICKDPFVGRATPWHEDSAYWEGLVSSYTKIVTIWLAIDPSTRENGCMRVIPQSHHNGFSEYEPLDNYKLYNFSTQIKDVDETKAVYFELQRGEFSLHDARLIHGAEANTSPLRRCGYTMRYFSTEIKFYPEKRPGHKIWLARGKDLAGNHYENA
jgi:ectoine hydroxylase-related dioxygenase (phytanoyl-CoA dioxygenase family)